MNSANLGISKTWQDLGPKIGHQYRGGMPFDQILEMNVAIKQRDLAPYQAHIDTLNTLLWPDDDEPKVIVEVGPGHGAMANFWPGGSIVYNIDLPEMLEIQRDYVTKLDAAHLDVHYVHYKDADSVPFADAYLFSVWALTETTPETWAYYIGKAKFMRGIYVLGHEQWEHYPRWPWEKMVEGFPHITRQDRWSGYSGAMEICAHR